MTEDEIRYQGDVLLRSPLESNPFLLECIDGPGYTPRRLSAYDGVFASKLLTFAPYYQTKDFLDYQFNNTDDKEAFITNMVFSILPRIKGMYGHWSKSKFLDPVEKFNNVEIFIEWLTGKMKEYNFEGKCWERMVDFNNFIKEETNKYILMDTNSQEQTVAVETPTIAKLRTKLILLDHLGVIKQLQQAHREMTEFDFANLITTLLISNEEEATKAADSLRSDIRYLSRSNSKTTYTKLAIRKANDILSKLNLPEISK